jgi:2-polyprenyl-3-methyl-5-hydroxy-6-metoxy-1,4-benzoquinol methylase
MQLSKRNNISIDPYTETAKYFESIIGTESAKKECNDLEEIFSYDRVKKILDFGCGTGLHSIELGRRGYEITGIDISKEMIDIANTKSFEGKIKFINSSIFNLDNEKFDACISMWNVVGYILTKEELILTFKEIRKRLRGGALFILDTFNGMSVYKLGPQYTYKERIIEKDRVIKIGIPFFDDLHQILDIKFKYIVFRNGKFKKEIDEVHTMRVYMPLEIMNCLSESGFKLETITSVDNYPNDATEIEWDVRYIAKAI